MIPKPLLDTYAEDRSGYPRSGLTIDAEGVLLWVEDSPRDGGSHTCSLPAFLNGTLNSEVRRYHGPAVLKQARDTVQAALHTTPSPITSG